MLDFGVGDGVDEAWCGEGESAALGVDNETRVGSAVGITRGVEADDSCLGGRGNGAGSDGPISNSVIALVKGAVPDAWPMVLEAAGVGPGGGGIEFGDVSSGA
jgi:hypothetical protein